MRSIALALTVSGLALLFVDGCSKRTKPPAGSPADQAFEARWAALESKGVKIARIEDNQGEALMGNVRGTRSDSKEGAPDVDSAPTGDAQAPIEAALVEPPVPEILAPEVVQQVIRGSLAGVKGCYMTLERTGNSRSGKAITTFEIDVNGKVQQIKVDAPTFENTNLSTCMAHMIARWSFPKSQKGSGAVSYPFVFVSN